MNPCNDKVAHLKYAYSMKVLLVSMPWAAVDSPSLALGILKREISGLDGVEVSTVYANIDYLDWMSARSPFRSGETIHLFGYRDYMYFSVGTYFRGLGDWIFSSALHGVPSWRISEFREQLSAGMDPRMIELTEALHKLAPAFVAELADRIVAMKPDVVGLTTTFQQNAASLALARAVKQRNAGIVTIFGGANCDGSQGQALHRNFECVDYVVRGEGEVALGRLLGVLNDEQAASDPGSLAGIPGLCWRDMRGQSVANDIPSRGLNFTKPQIPDYDEYFDRFSASMAKKWSVPRLVVEGSRGCWWGQKHHCTFCGLNGSFMEFRSKSPRAFAEEVLALVERHQIMDIAVSDNILDPQFITGALPIIAAKGYDIHMFFEIKSNMRKEQLETLLKSGVTNVQPGIENLSANVLRIMDKGVTGCLNVRLLRDAESIGSQVSWNYLYGFPGEEEADYKSIIEQFPALHHLPPPDGSNRIAIERFSPYFEKPELGFAGIKPARTYPIIYDLPEQELRDLAYIFESTPLGVGDDIAGELERAVSRWRRAYYEGRSRLTFAVIDGCVVLVSDRDDFDWHTLVIADRDEIAIFDLLTQPRSVESLARYADESLGGRLDLRRLLARWQELGIVFSDGGQLIQVAAEARNQELTRVSVRRMTVRAIEARRVPDESAAGAWGGRE
jgi:ribosomal peptide maturation radical SAM protein 1